MTKHTMHDGVIKTMHEYDKQSASETIPESYNSRLSYI